MRNLLILALTLLVLPVFSQKNVNIKKVEPPFWWTDMNNQDLQVLVYGTDIGFTEPIIDYPGLVLLETQRVENPNYMFINLRINETCLPGRFTISFKQDDQELVNWDYELKKRKTGSADRQGFDKTDALYLLMPDRFSNGDKSNDLHRAMLEQTDRTNPDGRHGGDIKGIIDHLDYIKETGFTGLWINPLIENNNPAYSYHGYAATDFYNVDMRFGNNQDYLNLVNQCHVRKMKVVMDVIFNHSSIHHWFIKDLPEKNWINSHDEYTPSNFRASTIMDPHASDYDKNKMLTGWFDKHMADLNQQNPLLATYLIQNSIWWIEYSGIDGIRVDTQPYPYKEFMSDWGKAIMDEYPNFNIVGEAWLQKEAFTAYFQKGTLNKDGYDSNIPSITDFPLYYALGKAFMEEDSWTDGLLRFYFVLAHDYLYGDAYENMIFADNHDLTRYFTSIHSDYERWKMAMVVMSTMRGIPCFYYGTEILMEGNQDDGHGFIRQDFPGGWPQDERSAFTSEGRTPAEEEAHGYLQKLLNWRKNQDAIHHGIFKHFIPEDNVYVYFRYTEDACVMVALNNSLNEMKALEHERYAECLQGYTGGINVITGEAVNYLEAFTIPPKSALVLELKK